jgi:hypothetical protein
MAKVIYGINYPICTRCNRLIDDKKGDTSCYVCKKTGDIVYHQSCIEKEEKKNFIKIETFTFAHTNVSKMIVKK